MRPSELTIRPTSPDDLDAIGEIYAHHVKTGVATFELVPPDQSEWRSRLQTVTARGLPFLTAWLGGQVAGYAYCSPWKSRPAYRHTVEDSIYVAPHAVGHGVGGQLLDTLLAECGRAAANGSQPEVVADAVLHALTSDKPRTRYPVGVGAKRMLFMRRLLPDRRFDRIILRAGGLDRVR